MPTVFSAKLDPARAQRLLGLLKGGTFAAWVRAHLDSADAQDRLAEVASETQRAVARLEAARTAEEAACARAAVAEKALAQLDIRMDQLNLLALAAAELRQELPLASALRRMATPAQAGSVSPGAVAGLLRRLAAWLASSGHGQRAATSAPEPIRARHWMVTAPRLTPLELCLWLVWSLGAAEAQGGGGAARRAAR